MSIINPKAIEQPEKKRSLVKILELAIVHKYNILLKKRNRKAAKRFLQKALGSNHNQMPRVITVNKNPAYPPAIDKLKNDKILPKNIGIRQIKYLNNIIEQDHRSIKRIINPILGFQSFRSANETLKGIEAMNMIRKGQIKNINY